MTTRLPFTEHSVRRAIKAARKEGFHVLGIKPDGTLLLGEQPIPVASLVPETAPSSKWEDVEA
jgi:hypothetical protein